MDFWFKKEKQIDNQNNLIIRPIRQSKTNLCVSEILNDSWMTKIPTNLNSKCDNYYYYYNLINKIDSNVQ